ncbi:MAG: hypothetical protein ACJA2M_002915 [Polaribacter sp.]|jgi:hypothetical protein
MKNIIFLLFIPLVSFGQNLFFSSDNSCLSKDFFRLEKGDLAIVGEVANPK